MSENNVPKHVAIILDGNGRWAKKRFLPRNAGHAQGSKTVEQICEDAHDLGIKYLTVYAFSTENWKRPKDEVDALMKLLNKYLKNCIERSTKNNMRVRVIGDITPLADDIKEKIVKLEEVSKNNTGLNFQVALNYGGRDEIIRAIKKCAGDCADGLIKPDDITEELFSERLDTSDIPDPDLLIRTSGEQRLSNFLLWQLAYTEFYFTDVLWPDFNKKELQKAIDYYASRDRRFGGV
ncbi:MAG: isoprenyl transferase [Lachnospiraceae bacterium]|nr:isoprenyl transferase [Lachnoclostridium sp.]MDY2599587.1 isoprenyl transferase [Lachnospiraceae bacterium]